MHDPLEPLETDQDAPIGVEIGSSHNSTDFQGILVTIWIADTVGFGLCI